MLRRLMEELKRQLQLPGEIPADPGQLRHAFGEQLRAAEGKGTAVLVIDAPNQMEDAEGGPDLAGLPESLPSNIRLLLSTLPGQPRDAARQRHWPTMEVEPFSPDERRRLVRDFLATYARSMSAARIDRLAAAPQCNNPLFLSVLLDELRLFGVHERLDERIGHYLRRKPLANCMRESSSGGSRITRATPTW